MMQTVDKGSASHVRPIADLRWESGPSALAYPPGGQGQRVQLHSQKSRWIQNGVGIDAPEQIIRMLAGLPFSVIPGGIVISKQ